MTPRCNVENAKALLRDVRHLNIKAHSNLVGYQQCSRPGPGANEYAAVVEESLRLQREVIVRLAEQLHVLHQALAPDDCEPETSPLDYALREYARQHRDGER